jgi:hypothetical protein
MHKTDARTTGIGIIIIVMHPIGRRIELAARDRSSLACRPDEALAKLAHV